MSIAPWQVHICALRCEEGSAVQKSADALYEELTRAGIEVIYDDRAVSAGVMFSDADLLGVPLRAVISPKTAERGVIEVKKRDKTFSGDVDTAEASVVIRGLVMEMGAELV